MPDRVGNYVRFWSIVKTVDRGSPISRTTMLRRPPTFTNARQQIGGVLLNLQGRKEPSNFFLNLYSTTQHVARNLPTTTSKQRQNNATFLPIGQLFHECYTTIHLQHYINTAFPAAALHLNTRRHQHVRSFDTDSVQSGVLLLFFTCRCPIYQTSVDTSTQYVGRWWHHDSAVATINPCSVQYQCSRLQYIPVSVVSNLCSNSSCPCVSNLSNLFMCVQCAWVLPF